MDESTGPEQGRNGAGTVWVSVAEAAAQLGLSERGVRKRIAAGRIVAAQTTEGWRVQVPAPVPEPDRNSSGPAAPSTGTEPEPASGLVAQLQAENAHLRHQLDAMHERLREAHLLLAQRPALPAPTAATVAADIMANDLPKPEENPRNDSEGSRPWWARWWPWRS
jgi:hypothetical protein